MHLTSFNFAPHPILVDDRPLHAVMVGRSDVTSIELDDGVLTVMRSDGPWFILTAFGSGRPVREHTWRTEGPGWNGVVTLPEIDEPQDAITIAAEAGRRMDKRKAKR